MLSIDLQRVADGPAERRVHRGEHGARRQPDPAPDRDQRRARRRASSTRLHERAAPALTSSTSASAPSAIFLLMIEAAMSGTLSIVPVTSRSA